MQNVQGGGENDGNVHAQAPPSSTRTGRMSTSPGPTTTATSTSPSASGSRGSAARRPPSPSAPTASSPSVRFQPGTPRMTAQRFSMALFTGVLGFPGSDLDGGTDHHHMPNGASEPVPCVDVCARAGEDIYTVFSDDFEAGVDEGILPFSRPAPLLAWRENAGERTAVSNDSAPSSRLRRPSASTACSHPSGTTSTPAPRVRAQASSNRHHTSTPPV
jgi:hypothetical protein